MPGGRFLSGSSLGVFEALMQESQPCLPDRKDQEMAVSCFFCRDTEKISGYQKILKELQFRIPDPQFIDRIEEAGTRLGGPIYRNREHEERYKGLIGHRQLLALDQKASYASALYLLSADGYLWGKARDAITMSQVLFPDIQLGGINVKGYILYHLAKDLYYRAGCVKVSDLSDRSLVDPGLFIVLLTGCLLREYGLERMEQIGMV